MQILNLTIYFRGRWFTRRLGHGVNKAQRDELVAADIVECLRAITPDASPAPQVLDVIFPESYIACISAGLSPPFENFMDSCQISVMLPTDCNLLGLEERLRPHLAKRFLHISERGTVVGALARQRVVLKAVQAWLHSPAQAEALIEVALPVRSWFNHR